MGVNGIYGLSGSGLDIESMVKVGMMSKQNEYDKMQQKYTQNEWKKASYLDLYGQVQTFNMSTLSQYKMSSNMNAHSATSSDESAVSVSANASAFEMTHYVRVNGLASNAYLVSGYGETEGVKTHNVGDKTSIDLAAALFKEIGVKIDENDEVVEGKIIADKVEYDSTAVAFQFSLGDASEISTESTTTPTNTDTKTANATITGTAKDVEVNFNVDNLDAQAFQFKISDGTKDATISFTYRQLQEASTTIESLTTQIANADLDIEVKSDDEGNFTLEGKNSSVKISISTIGTDEIAVNYLDRMHLTDANNSNNEFKDGSITAENFSEASSDTKTNGTGTKATVGNKQTLSVTYQQLLDGYTLNDLVADVNKLGTNVKAQYDSVQDMLSFYNTKSGKDNAISITIPEDKKAEATEDSEEAKKPENKIGERTAEFFTRLGLKQSINGELKEYDEGVAGEIFSAGSTNAVAGDNASATIDGVEYTNLDTNRTIINGVIYNFTKKTDNDITVTVTQDVDKIVDKVKSFVEDYNKLISSLYELYEEKPNSDYKPLTQAQKDEMKDEQIEKWEEKAKSGLLYHDSTLRKIISDMRDAVSRQVEGIPHSNVKNANGDYITYNNIFALGISTTGTRGQLVLNEDKLRTAIANDPDAVYNVFAKLDSNDDYSSNGVAQRLGDVFSAGMKAIRTRSGSDSGISEDSDLNNLLRELQTKMSNFKIMMNAFEDKLYKKYDAMETTLAMLGAQLNYVTTAFGG